MPKRRPPFETWFISLRPIIWKRDDGKCVRCGVDISLKECHIDHIVSGIFGSNKIKNLRTLCRRCHVLRLDSNHRVMVGPALKKGEIPPNWRNMTWD